MVDVAMLGTGGSMPMINRYLSAGLINYKGRKILVDCGEGTQVSMRMLGWGFKSIDVICITHIHGDHIVGLPGLLATIGNSGKTEPLIVVGPKGIEEAISALRVIVPYLPYELIILEEPENIELAVKKDTMILEDYGKGSISLRTVSLEHSAPCLGYGFYIKRQPKFDVDKAIANGVPKELWNIIQKEGYAESNSNIYTKDMVTGEERRGIKISYITDTRPTDDIVGFINESDLFICEGTYGSDDDIEKAVKNKHMTFREAAMLARNGNVRELMITHFSPAMIEPELFKDNAANVFENTVIAYDRIIKVLNFEE